MTCIVLIAPCLREPIRCLYSHSVQTRDTTIITSKVLDISHSIVQGVQRLSVWMQRSLIILIPTVGVFHITTNTSTYKTTAMYFSIVDNAQDRFLSICECINKKKLVYSHKDWVRWTLNLWKKKKKFSWGDNYGRSGNDVETVLFIR